METGPVVDLVTDPVAEIQTHKVRQPQGAEVIMPDLEAEEIPLVLAVEAVHHLAEILLGRV